MAMTLEEVRDGLRDYFIAANTDGVPFPHVSAEDLGNWCEALTTHLTQPAQAVDVGAIVESIASEWDGCMYESIGANIDIGEAIRSKTRALAGEQAGWRDDVLNALRSLKCPHDGKNGDVYEQAAAHVWGDAIITAMRAVQNLPASPTPDKETQR